MTVASCPGCASATMAADRAVADANANAPTHEILLPTIHCISCVMAVERVLQSQPGITAARVNLSRKRAMITAAPDADPTPWVQAVIDAGYEAHEGRGTDTAPGDGMLLLRLGVAGFAMMNVMLLSVAVWSGATDATRDFFHLISALIALPATVFSAQPFAVSAWRALQARRLNMDVPISLAIILACGLSLFEALTGGAEAYFDAALSLTFFLLAGRYLEQRMRKAARSAASDLAALEPRRTIRVVDGQHQSCAIDNIVAGDDLWLAAGSRVPVDGVLLSDTLLSDRSALTGESDLVACTQGATLSAGEVAMTGPVTIRASVDAQNSTLRRIIHLTSVAEGARGKYTSLADRAAQLYAPLVHGLALAAFLGWLWISGDAHLALTIAIATLIITCPCALGLAVPAVATVTTGRLFRNSVLVKSETALERMAEIDTVVFDKTGTLTRNRLIVPADLPVAHRMVLKTLAQSSNHPLSRSLLDQLTDYTTASLTHVAEVAGQGLSAEWEGQPVWLGTIPNQGTGARIGGATYVFDQVEDILPTAAKMIADLQGMGFKVHLLTGDKPQHAARVNTTLHCDTVHAGVTPEGKQDVIETLQAQGAKVLMVGDGLNDALALTAAWASIAPGTALEASQNAADMVVLSQDLNQMVTAIRLSRSARARILQNFGIAVAYNSIAVPLAVLGFATPLLAALAMSTSSILVTLNALRSQR